MNAIKTVQKMLAVSTPIITIDSGDHPHTVTKLIEAIDATKRPIIGWDVINGFTPCGKLAEKALAEIDPKELAAAKAGGAHAALVVAQKLPNGSILILDNVHWAWDKPPVMQALLNLREPFKATKRAAICLSYESAIPVDLQQSMSFVEDPLPSEETLKQTVGEIYKSALGADIEDEDAQQVARELRGASPFRAEQLAAQSLTKSGIDRDRLRDNARKQINDTVGLSVESSEETFDSIGGLDAMREFLQKYFAGPRSPDVVVRIEEIEKALAGVGSESSGTSGDALGVMLTAMEDHRWTGILAYGVSGCGKSLVAKAAANQFGAKAIRLDLNACKAGLVGESERQIRQAVDVLHAIGGERVFFIASMNQIASLPPELRRRFAAGTWYFDVPDADARKDIWRISCEAFGIEHDGYDADMLTGADIRDIAQRAYELRCSCTEAAAYHVPLVKAAPDAISQSRSDASGRYLDASAGGAYRDPSSASTSYDRSIDLD